MTTQEILNYLLYKDIKNSKLNDNEEMLSRIDEMLDKKLNGLKGLGDTENIFNDDKSVAKVQVSLDKRKAPDEKEETTTDKEKTKEPKERGAMSKLLGKAGSGLKALGLGGLETFGGSTFKALSGAWDMGKGIVDKAKNAKDNTKGFIDDVWGGDKKTTREEEENTDDKEEREVEGIELARQSNEALQEIVDKKESGGGGEGGGLLGMFGLSKLGSLLAKAIPFFIAGLSAFGSAIAPLLLPLVALGAGAFALFKVFSYIKENGEAFGKKLSNLKFSWETGFEQMTEDEIKQKDKKIYKGRRDKRQELMDKRLYGSDKGVEKNIFTKDKFKDMEKLKKRSSRKLNAILKNENYQDNIDPKQLTQIKNELAQRDAKKELTKSKTLPTAKANIGDPKEKTKKDKIDKKKTKTKTTAKTPNQTKKTDKVKQEKQQKTQQEQYSKDIKKMTAEMVAALKENPKEVFIQAPKHFSLGEQNATNN